MHAPYFQGKGMMSTFWLTGRSTSGSYKPPDSPKPERTTLSASDNSGRGSRTPRSLYTPVIDTGHADTDSMIKHVGSLNHSANGSTLSVPKRASGTTSRAAAVGGATAVSEAEISQAGKCLPKRSSKTCHLL